MIALVLAGTPMAYSPLLPATPMSRHLRASRSSNLECQLFSGQWPWSERSEDEQGKFVQHKELEPGCAPLGVVTAGLDDDALEALAETIEGVYEGPDGSIAHVPIAVLSKADLRLRMREVLAGLSERDSVLPDTPASVSVPLILLSGFTTTATSATVRAVRALGLTGGRDDARPMFAVAVPNALDKSFGLLIEEIKGDHLALKPKDEPSRPADEP